MLAAHRATYALTLGPARDGANVSAARGSLAYEVTDACDGWATQQRWDMILTTRDGQDIHTVSDDLTWESKDGTKLRFHLKRVTDTAVINELEGVASMPTPGSAGSVHYTKPNDTTVTLPAGTLFPMAHTAAIIAAAEAGEKFLTRPLFDGTGQDGAQNTSIFVSSWGGPSAAPYPDLAALPSGRVRLAYFAMGGDTSEPASEMSMRYWSNGVADEFAIDFSSFIVNGALSSFALSEDHC